MPDKTKIADLLNFGIINIDKPSGPTSFTVSDYIRKQFALKKTSHFGTLDPKVTGVLPIALGRACKLTGFFLGHDKEYVGIMHVHKEISLEDLQKTIDEFFIGTITQLPPKKSRVKRQEREREIKSFKLLEKNGKDFLFQAEVQGGTYIRKLIHDLGQKTELGAHMLELRRIRAGIFSESSSVTLYEFNQALQESHNGDSSRLRKMIVPAEEAIKKIMPVVQVKKEIIKGLKTGKPLFKKDILGKIPDEDLFAVFCDDDFIEIAKQVDQGDIIAKPEFVFN